MSTRRACYILDFLMRNVANGVESIAEARQFVRAMEDLEESEHCFLGLALQNRGTMEEFYREVAVPLVRSEQCRCPDPAP